ncbi:MAG: response regulator [Polyangiales bacterium]
MGRARVMIVEDERIVALELEDRLRRMGYDVVGSFGSGEQAVRAAPDLAPELAVLDIRLAGSMDGVDVAEDLKRRLDLAIVFLSAYADDETVSRVKATEPLGYVLKPFEERALQATIETALFRHRAERERRLADEARRAAEARWVAILENSADAVVSIDASEQITVFNRAAERMFGWSSAEVLGQALGMLLPEGVRAQHRAHVESYLANAEPPRTMGERGRLHGRRRDGTLFPIEASISKLTHAGEVFLTAVVRDVSKQLELEEQLRCAQQLEAVGRLASTVVHDVNNLLAVVQHAVDLSREAPASWREQLDVVSAAVTRGAAITRRLLLYARKQPRNPDVVEVDALLIGMRALLENVADESHRVQWSLAACDARVFVDPRTFEQVILNCIANARDAMPFGGTVSLRTALVEHAIPRGELPAGHYVAITIEDCGVGIAPELLPRVFDPFFTTKEPGRGTGLGLSSARDAVRQAGGAIEVESEPKRGTVVTIYLPRTDAPLPVPQLVPTLPERIEPLTVLIVDDEDHLARILSRALAQRGFVVRTAAGVGEAFASLEAEGAIDVLITDVVMPIMSGPELAQRMRRYLPGLSVVYMTGYAHVGMPLDDPRAVVVSKPFEINALVGHILTVHASEET